jgi:hypothetical protein
MTKQIERTIDVSTEKVTERELTQSEIDSINNSSPNKTTD